MGLKEFSEAFLEGRLLPGELSFSGNFLTTFKNSLIVMTVIGFIFLILGAILPEALYTLYPISAGVAFFALMGMEGLGRIGHRIASWFAMGIIPSVVLVSTAIAQSLA